MRVQRATPSSADRSTTGAKSSAEDLSKKVSKLIVGDENHLSVREVWEKLNDNAQVVTIRQIGYYIGRWPADDVVAKRTQRGQAILRELGDQIEQLKKLNKARLRFETLQIPGGGKLVDRGDPFWATEHGPLSRILSSEIIRLAKEHGRTKRMYSAKKLGVGRQHLWLVFAQEYVRAWSEQNLGKSLSLTPRHITNLIDTVYLIDGYETWETIEPMTLKKAISNFKKNNPVFFAALKCDPLRYVS